MRQPQQPAAEAPKPVDEDPIAAVKRHEEELAQLRQTQTTSRAIAQLDGMIVQAEHDFRQEQPLYDAAINYLADAKRREYAALGVPAGRIEELLIRDARVLANDVFSKTNGQGNPAAVAYQWALSRGFTPPAATEEKPAEEKPAEVPAEKQMDMLEAGARASKGAQGGGTAVGDVTLEAIANMSSKEIGSLSEAQWRKAMMGRA